MAESLDDGEFWLPPEFLTDNDIATEKNERDSESTKTLFPFEFSYGGFGSSSDLSSPVESVVGSSETESDEEDYLTGLTRQMTRSTLLDDSTAFASEKSKAWVVSGSPQSTLCAVGSGCGCRQGSSNGSPNGPSHVSSSAATWDLLYAAAGEVARMRKNDELYGLNHGRGGGVFGPPRKPSPVTVPVKNNSNPDVGFFPRQSLSHHQLQATQFHQLRQQQMIKQQGSSAVWGGQAKASTGRYQQRQTQQIVQNRGRTSEFVGARNTRPLGLSPSAWPPLQQAQQQQQQQQQNLHQNNGSGMRAVFLGTPGGKRECAGTGVFLPRRVDNPSDARRKPACSTVLVPARVVQALNLNLEDMMGAQSKLQPRFNANFTPDTDDAAAAIRFRSTNVVPHQKRNVRPQQEMNHEIRLPQEWTY